MLHSIDFRLSAALYFLWLGAAAFAAEPTARELDFFERKIRPVLVESCYECHSSSTDDPDGGLTVDTAEGLLLGGETGTAVVPKNPRESLLLSAIEYGDLEMPPDGKLPDEVIRDFRRWINMGAPDPRQPTKMRKADPTPTEEPTDEGLWSLQPVQVVNPPDVADAVWSQTAIDRFIFARLRENGLVPVAPASPLELLRRVSFDLIGLPPSPEDVAAFGSEPSSETYEGLIDRLLSSPQFGERWGRHWLDAVRYGESAGSSRDVLMPYAWRYRDYVIDVFNHGVPYNQFLTEQLAGDLLPADSPEERDRLTVATGLLAIGSKSLNGGNLELDIVDDQIDVIGKAMLGMTISCARCHDHKFDPIPTADYYALAGIFRSTETYYGGNTKRPKQASDALKVYLPLGEGADQAAEAIRQHEQNTAALTKQKNSLTKQIQQLQKKLPEDWKERKADLDTTAEESEQQSGNVAVDQVAEVADAVSDKDEAFLAQVARFEQTQQKLRQVEQELKAAGKSELPELKFAVGVRDKNKIADSPIQVRGEKNRQGEVVPRGFLTCVTTVTAIPEISAEGSGRLELAQWLTDENHPLTARVAVNRIWQHLFGRGLVETVDNFGINGLPPSHPQLLDYLAHRFVHEHNWSTKSLIREIVLTRTYQLSSQYDESAYAVDPENTLLWRMSRRRLEAEAIRDAMLTAAGVLELDRPHASAVAQIGEGEVGRGINTKPLHEPFPHRSVYLPIIRGLVPEVLKVFDFPEPSNPQGVRDVTNVPTQSLFLMNSPFVIEQSERFAQRVTDAADDDQQRIQLAYTIAFGREPTDSEVARSTAMLKELHSGMEAAEPNGADKASWAALCQALFASAEFRYID